MRITKAMISRARTEITSEITRLVRMTHEDRAKEYKAKYGFAVSTKTTDDVDEVLRQMLIEVIINKLPPD